MLTREDAIETIESVLQEAATRVTKPLRLEAAAAARAEALTAYDNSPARFPNAAILAKFVQIRTSATPSVAAQGQAGPPADANRRHVPLRKKPILDEMSPGGENSLRRLEGD